KGANSFRVPKQPLERAGRSFFLWQWRNSHDTAKLQRRRLKNSLRDSFDILRSCTAASRVIRQVDLHKRLNRTSHLDVTQRIYEAFTIDRMDRVRVLRGLFCLIRLQLPDEVPT